MYIYIYIYINDNKKRSKYLLRQYCMFCQGSIDVLWDRVSRDSVYLSTIYLSAYIYIDRSISIFVVIIKLNIKFVLVIIKLYSY